MKIVLKSITFMVAVILLASSCVKEKMSECKGVILLRCAFTLNESNDNLFGSEVDQIRIYAFDKDSLYIGSPEYTVYEHGDKLQNDYRMKLELPVGKYFLVAVGGDVSDYHIGEMFDESKSSFKEELIEGVTTLSSFRLLCASKQGGGDEIVLTDKPEDFYMGSVSEVQLKGDVSVDVVIELTKNTNNINVKIVGSSVSMKAREALPFDIHCTSKNGRYNWINDVTEGAYSLKYQESLERIHPDTLSADFKVMRLLMDGDSRLVLADNKNSARPIFDIDLVEEILNNPKYASQEDLDRADQYNIIINVDQDIIISITVNGWKTVYLQPEL